MSIVVKSLSFSTVDTYISCPEKCMLDKIDHVPKKGVAANLLMGTCIHAAAEAWYRGLFLNHVFDFETIFKVFKIRWSQTPEEEIIYTGKERDEIFEKARFLLEMLINSEQPHQILAVERALSYQLTNNLVVVGKADLIYRDKDGWLTITDLKTSARAYGFDEIFRATCQVYTYALALPEPVKLRVKLFLKTKEARIDEIILNPEDVDFTDWKSRFIEVKRAIESNIRYKNRSFQCKTCSYSHACNQTMDVDMCNERKAA